MFADMLLIVEISNKNIMVKPFDTGSGADDLLNSFSLFPESRLFPWFYNTLKQ